MLVAVVVGDVVPVVRTQPSKSSVWYANAAALMADTAPSQLSSAATKYPLKLQDTASRCWPIVNAEITVFSARAVSLHSMPGVDAKPCKARRGSDPIA